MDNLTGLSSVPSYPSSSLLKEQLLDVLEAKEFDLDALLKLLGLERRPLQHLKTVRELFNYYEEHNEQLSLQTWERIFEELGYSEDFLRVVTHFNEQRHGQGSAELAVANLRTTHDKKNDESGASCNGLVSPKDTNNEKVAVHGNQQLVAMAATAELSDHLAEIYDELNNGSGDTAEAAIKVTEQPTSPPAAMSSRKVQPSLSLPPVSPDDKQPDDYLTNFTSQSSVSVTRAKLDDDYITNLTGQSSGHVTGANLYDSGFSSVSDTGHSLLLSGDASSSSTSSSSSSSPLNSIVTKTEQCVSTSMTRQGMTSATNLSTTTCSVLSQTSAPTVSNATVGLEPIAPVVLQTSSPLSNSSQCNSNISNPPNEMVDNLSLSSDFISETDQQQNVMPEEDYSARSSSSVYGSQTDISNHGSEASLRQAATCTAATSFPSLATLPLRLPILGRGSETENYDASESVGLVEELQKKIEELESNVNFLVQKLRTQTLLYENVRDRNSCLQQNLSECRSQCAELQEQMEELTRHLNQSAELEAESQQLIRMTQKLVHLKQEECDRLQEHIRQSDARYDNVISSAEAMEREKQEVSELSSQLLVSLRTQILEIQQKHEEFRVEERQRLRLENDRVMEEACLAFNSAESDRVKILKLKLRKEKARRKKGDERNEKLLKENEQLKAMVSHLKSEEETNGAGAAACCGDSDWQSCVFGEEGYSSSTNESSAGEADDVDHISGSGQPSDSGDSSDDEQLFEDAPEYLST